MHNCLFLTIFICVYRRILETLHTPCHGDLPVIGCYIGFTIRGVTIYKKSRNSWSNGNIIVSLHPDIPPVSLCYLIEYCGFVGSGMYSRNAQILSRSLRKEFENSCVRGTLLTGCKDNKKI